MINLYNGNCLEIMKQMPDKSVDLILCDLPYGVTNCEWDTPIQLDLLWKEYKRIIKDTGSVILFSNGLFTFKLINSNINNFKYRMIWKKNTPTGMSSSKYRPMKYYEEICVFQFGKAIYNPIMQKRTQPQADSYKYNHYCGKNNHINVEKINIMYDPTKIQPGDVLEFKTVPNRKGKLHPTQKPVELLEYLIKTYTNENSVVLDNCMGSGSTGVACINTNRNFIGIELDKKYYDIAVERINNGRLL